LDYLSFDLRLLMAIELSVLWFTTSDGHWIICPLIYDFWWPLDYLSFDLRLLMAIGLSVLWFKTSDGHWITCPLIYDFWWLLDYLSFDLRLLMAIGLSVLWFTTSDGHWIICPLIYDFWLPLWVSSNFSIWTHIQWKIICLKCVACFLKFTKTDFLQTPINQSINQSNITKLSGIVVWGGLYAFFTCLNFLVQEL
jgi:hypothetical protein